MAIWLPFLPVNVRRPTQGDPILAGTVLRETGWRGIIGQQNHAYAYRTQYLASGGAEPGVPVDSSTVLTWHLVQDWGEMIISDDVTALQLWADVEDLQIAIEVDGVSTSSAAMTGRHVIEVERPVTAGTRRVAVYIRSRADGTLGHLHSYIIRERRLVAAEIP